MLILLPPSESKTPATTGEPVELPGLRFPALSAARERLVTALIRISGQKNALSVLDVGESLSEDVARNRQLWSAPAAPALQIYSGVLYDALSYGTLTPAARAVADESLVVISALWGAATPTDRIPAYRLSMGTDLPRIGKLSTWWKPRLTPVLDDASEGHVVVDCRSAAYAAAWKAPVERTVGIRVEQLAADGKRSVVSHNAKHTRGLAARHLCETEASGTPLASVADVRDALAQRWTVELAAATARKPATLTVVLDPA